MSLCLHANKNSMGNWRRLPKLSAKISAVNPNIDNTAVQAKITSSSLSNTKVILLTACAGSF